MPLLGLTVHNRPKIGSSFVSPLLFYSVSGELCSRKIGQSATLILLYNATIPEKSEQLQFFPAKFVSPIVVPEGNNFSAG
jgi:hypothetical protein